MSNGDRPDALRLQDEALQILYWLRGERLMADIGVADLKRFLDGTTEDLAAVLERLVEIGLVRRIGWDTVAAARYALTPDGVREGGRRFADEFADMTKPGHGECGDPECDCHRTGSPADCVHRH
jgi:hypothetical protein